MFISLKFCLKKKITKLFLHRRVFFQNNFSWLYYVNENFLLNLFLSLQIRFILRFVQSVALQYFILSINDSTSISCLVYETVVVTILLKFSAILFYFILSFIYSYFPLLPEMFTIFVQYYISCFVFEFLNFASLELRNNCINILWLKNMYY